MRISDWSSDVCSSDLFAGIVGVPTILGPMIVYAYAMGIIIHNTMAGAVTPYREMAGAASALLGFLQMATAACATFLVGLAYDGTAEIGRAPCRERVCQYV